jgi:hypothetical protein
VAKLGGGGALGGADAAAALPASARVRRRGKEGNEQQQGVALAIWCCLCTDVGALPARGSHVTPDT